MKLEKNSAYTVKNVNCAIELLEILAENPTSASLIQLTEKIGLNRNNTFRLLATLCEKGVVERDPINGNYQLGAYSVVLAQKFLRYASVVNYAHPVMEGLARKHHEAVYMTVAKEDEVLFLDMVDCEQHIKAAPLVGKRFPFFTNSAGKVIKALESREFLEKFLSKRSRKLGGADFAKLATELEEIRSRGVAVDNGGLGEGIISVAVAIRDYAGKVVGAITMLGPSFRMLTERLENEIIPSMLEEAEILSGKFGYAPS